MFRWTPQRALLWSFMRENYTHPTVEEAFQYARQHLPHLSKKTVYEALRALTKEGYIRELDLQGILHYEPAHTKLHAHFICRQCGKVEDLPNQSIPITTIAKEGRTHLPHHIDTCQVTFSGLCEQCLQNT